MKRPNAVADSPEAYVDALMGWRKPLVERLRAATLGAGKLEEKIKWGHLVYFANGPVSLIRAEEQRVLFGFWRGQRLRDLDDGLKPGGKYEMATITFADGDTPAVAHVTRLVKAAIALNCKLGDPTGAAPKRLNKR